VLEIIHLGLERVFECIPGRLGDNRGYFSETYNKERFHSAGITEEFVQDNHSRSVNKGTLRGLHLQLAPMAQAKLVRVTQGSIFDVAVDIRTDSPDFGKWVGIILSAEKGNQIFVPAGFAHGFVTLEDECHVTYKVDNYYSADHDRSIRFDDPLFTIEWPMAENEILLSEKDRNAPRFESMK